MSHFTSDEIQCFFHNALVCGLFRDLPCMQICADEKRIIVQHFFKVRYTPEFIGTVSCKTTTDDIIHAAARHCIETVIDKLDVLFLFIHNGVMKQELDHHCLRKFGGI